MPFNEDLSVFFKDDEFAEQAVLKNGLIVSGGFDDGYFNDGLGVTQKETFFTAPANYLLSVKKGDEITIKSKKYCVAEIQPDDNGITVLKLELI